MQTLYPSGIVVEQNATFELNYTDGYSFSIEAPFECQKAVITIYHGDEENLIRFNVMSDSASENINLHAGYGIYEYNKPCKKITMTKVDFPEGHSETFFTLNIKMYY